MKRLLLPYVLYSLLNFALNVAKVVLLHNNINLIHNLMGIIVQMRGTEFSLGVWFLPLLFLSEALIYPLVLLKKWTQYIFMLVLLGIGFVYSAVIHQVLPWGLDVVPFASFFIWLGYQYKNAISVETIKVPKVLCSFICIVLLMVNIITGRWNNELIGYSVDMYVMRYGNPVLYLITAITGIGFILAICRNLINNLDLNALKYIGQNTLHIYGIHGLVIAIIRAVKEKVIGTNVFETIPEQLLISVAVLAISLCLIYWTRFVSRKVVNWRYQI